jgi:hypothetical protein
MDSLVDSIKAAFEARAYPGDENITRCTYDKKNGATHDGPCWECQEMAEYFEGKRWSTLVAWRCGSTVTMTHFTVPATATSYRLT